MSDPFKRLSAGTRAKVTPGRQRLVHGMPPMMTDITPSTRGIHDLNLVTSRG